MRWSVQEDRSIGQPGEAGGVLPAALLILTLTLLIGLEAALVAGSVRWGTARAQTGEQAYRTAEAGLALAMDATPAALLAGLASGDPLELGVLPDLPGDFEVRVRDDDDGAPAAEINGRLLFLARGEQLRGPGRWRAIRRIDAAVLVGAFTPLVAAAVDCTDAAELCDDTDGCDIPAARVVGEGTALATSRARLPALRQRLWVLAREVLRRIHDRCVAGRCSGDDEALWRAAGTEVVQLVDDPEANALSARPEEVARLVGNLLDLDGDETGAGWITWADGTTRPVMRMQDLVAILEDLQRAEGHLPDLSDHPFPALLFGTAETAFDQGLCGRL
ncbi:MAG: hypothetical protein ACE5IK_14410, partial [Acidobacteriota bacterium]